MIGIPLREVGLMTLGEFNDAIAAFNAAHDEETGPVLTDTETDDLAAMMGIE